MMRMIAKAWMVTIAALVAASAASAQGAEIAPRLEPGRTLNYELGFVLERGLVMGAGEDRLVQEAGLALEITDVDEAGVATVAGKIEWIVIDIDRAAFRIRYDSREVQGDAANLAERTIRDLAARYLEDVFSLRVSPSGEVLELTGFDSVEAMLAEQPGSLARLTAGRMLPPTLREDLEPIFTGDGIVGRDLEAGDSWTTSRRSELGAGVLIELSTDWTVTEAADRFVRYSGDIAADLIMPEARQEMPIVFELTEQEGEASSVWDLAAGALGSREAYTAYTVTVSVEDQSQQSQRSGRSSLRLVSFSPEGG